MDIIQFFSSNGFLAWLSLAAIFLALELATNTTYLLWASIAAAITSVIALVFPSMSVAGGITIFAVLTIITVYVAKRFFPKQEDSHTGINDPSARLIGEKVVAIEDFNGGIGYISHGDTRWRALCETSNPVKGTSLTIKGIEGATVFVELAN